MSDEQPASEPQNIRILYAGPGITCVQPGDVFSRSALAALHVSESELLLRGEAELTDAAPTVEPEMDASAADMPKA